MKKLTISIKIILIILFAIAAFNLPYSYYQIIKTIGMFGLIYLAYSAYVGEQKPLMIVLIIFAILFNPFPAFKIYFPKEIWRVIDIIASLTLVISFFLKSKNDNSSN